MHPEANVQYPRNKESYEGINLLVALCIMVLDMLELSRLLEGWYVPIQLP